MFFLINLYLWYCSGKVDEKATQLHAIASLKVLLDATTTTTTAGTTAGIQELPNGGIAAGLDAGLDSVIVQFTEYAGWK